MPPHDADSDARTQRLRNLFLDDSHGSEALPDYWRDRRDLAAYAQLLAVRIGWKWDAALRECRDRGYVRDETATVLDFGCGSGIAAERFVHWFGARAILCHDRSPVAMQFAVQQLRAVAKDRDVQALPDVAAVAPDVLLVSHVLGELDDAGFAHLLTVARRAQRIVVVEPGNRPVSRRLGALREQLRSEFAITAPCPHAGACPSLANDADWCHFFAPPPPEVFTEGHWVVAARDLGIDMRSLPYSFVAFARTATAVPAPPHRLLGRPDVGKHDAHVQQCTATGLATVKVTKRARPDVWRTLKKDPLRLRELPPDDAP